MSALSLTPRLALLATTAAATLVAAALSWPAPASAQGDRVIGPITSVTGNTFEVAQSSGSTTVEVTESTTISEAVPAQLSDVTVGSCVKAGPTPDSAPADSGAITAKWVTVSPTVDGKCPQRPASSPPAPQPAQHHIRGVVNSVAGNTVTVTRADGSGNATVTVTDATHYRKRVASGIQAITQGKCAVARGASQSSGVLQAAKVVVWASNDGNCPQPAAP